MTTHTLVNLQHHFGRYDLALIQRVVMLGRRPSSLPEIRSRLLSTHHPVTTLAAREDIARRLHDVSEEQFFDLLTLAAGGELLPPEPAKPVEVVVVTLADIAADAKSKQQTHRIAAEVTVSQLDYEMLFDLICSDFCHSRTLALRQCEHLAALHDTWQEDMIRISQTIEQMSDDDWWRLAMHFSVVSSPGGL